MKSAKQTDHQERITQAAFEEWGRSNFTNMSLSSLATRLGLTKPALYRHFPGKQALIDAMEKHFLADYAAMHRTYLSRAETRGLAEAVELFVDQQFRFFYGRPYYYVFFLMRMLRTPLGERPEIQGVMADQMLFFKQLFAGQGRRISAGELFARLHYLYVAAIFWSSRTFFDCATGFATVPVLTEEEIQAEISRTTLICVRGLVKNPRPEVLDYPHIEEKCTVRREEMPAPDRIFTAIQKVVSEVGLRDASLDRIAARIGMTKSSLYFYFKNKDDMLSRMLERERSHATAILKDRLAGQRGFPSRSYSYMVVTATYTLNNPALLTVYNWLRFQNIAMQIAPPEVPVLKEYFSFIFEAFEQGELLCGGDDILHAAAFLHVLAFRIVMDMRNMGRDNDSIMSQIRVFHKLYLHGFFADNIFPEEKI